MAAEKLSGRPCRCRQAPETTSDVRSTVQNLVKHNKHVNESRTYANPDKCDDGTNATKG
jgi:hypothetical protein